MGATVERKRPWKFEGYREEEGTSVITLTLPRRLAWALGTYSRGQGVDLGLLCFAALKATIQAKRIPWSWFEEILAAEKPDRPQTVSEASQETQAVEPGEAAGPVAAPPALDAAPEPGRAGKGSRKDPERLREMFGRKAG
jgi:hypothetical protein